jgi:hypothetical protein
MKKFRILLIACLIAFALPGYSQYFEVPVDYNLVTKEDYAPYEKDVIEAAKWLIETPFKQEKYKRKLASKFVFDWVNGSPTVFCGIPPVIFDFERKNKGMMVNFMACVARYSLENKNDTAIQSKYLFAVNELIVFYKKNKDLAKDKKMDKLIKAKEQGKMEEWMAEFMKMDR